MSKVVGKSRESRRASKSRAPSSEKVVSTAVQTSQPADDTHFAAACAAFVADIRRREEARALQAETERARLFAPGVGGDGLTRCAHVFDNRKWLATSGVRGAFFTGLNRVDLLFYENKNGRLPAEIESAFTCACDELRRAGHDDTEAVVVLLHEQLAEKFAKTAEVHREAMRLFHEYEHAAKIESSITPAILNEPPPTEPGPWDEADHAQWEQTMREREAAQDEMLERFGGMTPSVEAFSNLASHFCSHYQPSLESLEECFELIVSAIRRIIKVGLKDRSAEAVEAVKKLMEQKIDAIAAMTKNTYADVAELNRKGGSFDKESKDVITGIVSKQAADNRRSINAIKDALGRCHVVVKDERPPTSEADRQAFMRTWQAFQAEGSPRTQTYENFWNERGAIPLDGCLICPCDMFDDVFQMRRFIRSKNESERTKKKKQSARR